MSSRCLRLLVIDASVVCSASEKDVPRSRHCREFLQVTLDCGHCVVLTPEIQAEWNERRSNFSLRWRLSMTARRRIHKLSSVYDPRLRGRLEHIAKSEQTKELMLED